MADKAHIATDKRLLKMERHLSAIFSRANKELTEKAEAYFKRFEELDRQKQKLLADGKITEAEYRQWRVNKMMTGKHWENLQEESARILYDADRIATAYINGEVPEIYTLNYNHIAKGFNLAQNSISFELVSAEVIRNLATKDTTLLPYKVVDGKKLERWNTKALNAEVMQGILQGESVDKIAKRFRNVTEMDKVSAIRNARTTITSAENKGRLDMMENAEEKGIEVHKVWLAVEDDRTRDWHRELDGVDVPIDEPFINHIHTKNGDYEDKIMYPSDPNADPANTYNCRCTMTTKIIGFKSILPKEKQGKIKVNFGD